MKNLVDYKIEEDDDPYTRTTKILIRVESAGFEAGNYANITVCGVKVVVQKNCNGHYRGLHIVVINPNNGVVETAKVFDTYESSKEFEEFIDKPLPIGHIVVAACKDECSNHLSHEAKMWFCNMGANEIWFLTHR